MTEYDYLIVGSGLFGATFGHEMKKNGMKCLVIEKRPHIGGNIYTEEKDGIQIHMYGPHIFHTNDYRIWSYINKFATFNRFTNSPLAVFKDKIYNLPFNMNTFNRIWGVKTPNEARSIIKKQLEQYQIKQPKNLEEKAISMVGPQLFKMFIKGYTEKQWGLSCKDLPPQIISRIPIRFDYDNNYFKDRYQGIPIGGYTQIINKMLKGIECRVNIDFFSDLERFYKIAKKIVYTGPIDRFFNYSRGKLDYRSLHFEHSYLEMENFQGNAVINYCEREIPYTRIIEHKKFDFGIQPSTVISKEFPVAYNGLNEPYYPIVNRKNKQIYNEYVQEAKKLNNVIFGGRLAEFKYYDMHQVIASALKTAKKELQFKTI